MEYTFEVTETRKMRLTVEAESVEEAEQKAEADYYENIAIYDAQLDVYDTQIERLN